MGDLLLSEVSIAAWGGELLLMEGCIVAVMDLLLEGSIVAGC